MIGNSAKICLSLVIEKKKKKKKVCRKDFKASGYDGIGIMQ